MISFIIASITKDHETLNAVIDSLNYHDLEVIVVSPYPIDNPRVTFVKDVNCNGSCSAFNLGAKHAKGDYLAIGTDDTLMTDGWWECASSPFCSFRTGMLHGRKVPHTFCMSRSFYEGDLMKGNIFNPALFHMYLDVDLGYALAESGINFPEVNRIRTQIEKDDDNKMEQKNKFYRVDGMILNKMWAKKYPPVPLFDVMGFDLDIDKQLNNNFFSQWNI